jgi:hypothetical protein
MKARILFLASILVALSGMLVIPGMAEVEVEKASACPDTVICRIPPAQSFGFPPEGDILKTCVSDCEYCCEEWCPNQDAWDVVGDPGCYCTVAGEHAKCGKEPQP